MVDALDVGREGAGFPPALRAQLLRQLGADEVVVAQQAGDDDAVPVGQPGVPFRGSCWPFMRASRRSELIDMCRKPRSVPPIRTGTVSVTTGRPATAPTSTSEKCELQLHRVVDLGQLPPRQWGAPRHARVQELLAVEVAIEQLQPQRMERGRGPLVKGLQVAGGELGRSRRTPWSVAIIRSSWRSMSSARSPATCSTRRSSCSDCVRASRTSNRPVATSVGTTRLAPNSRSSVASRSPPAGRRKGGRCRASRRHRLERWPVPPNAAADRPTRPSPNATQKIPLMPAGRARIPLLRKVCATRAKTATGRKSRPVAW